MTMMQFFTPEWRDGELSDVEYERTFERYEAHFRALRDRLPDELRQFLESVSLHDAMVRKASLERRVFRLSLRAGDLQAGYSDVLAEYREVELLDGIPSVAEVLNAPDAEIIESEAGIAEATLFEHRILFAPSGELRVRFRSFSFRITPVEGRDFETEMPAFQHSDSEVG